MRKSRTIKINIFFTFAFLSTKKTYILLQNIFTVFYEAGYWICHNKTPTPI